MTLSYGGIPLTVGTPELTDWIEANISLAEVVQFQQRSWPGGRLANHTATGFTPARRLKVGTLYWPRDASRFAIGNFLATGNQLKQILPLVYGYAGGLRAPVSQILHLDSGNADFVEVPLFMLPARPLGGLGDQVTGNPLYLLTLVDDRYFWSERESGTAFDDPVWTNWTDLFTNFAEDLNIVLQFDPTQVNGSYLQPAASLSVNYEDWPTLLDAAEYNIAHRLVANYDGTYQSMDLPTSQSIFTANFAQVGSTWPQQSGGFYDFTPADPANDLPIILPTQFAFGFSFLAPGQLQQTWWPIIVVTSNLTGFNTISGNGSTKRFLETFQYRNDIFYVINLGAQSSGTFTLAFNNQVTTQLQYFASSADITTALAALPNIGAGNVVVTGPPGGLASGGPFNITLTPALNNLTPGLTADFSKLQTPGNASLVTNGVNNSAAAQTLATQFATDWCNYQTSAADVRLRGICAWQPEGLSDSIEWSYRVRRCDGCNGLGHGPVQIGDDGKANISTCSVCNGQKTLPDCGTRVQRPPFNDLASELMHDDGNSTPLQPTAIWVISNIGFSVDNFAENYVGDFGLGVSDLGYEWTQIYLGPGARIGKRYALAPDDGPSTTSFEGQVQVFCCLDSHNNYKFISTILQCLVADATGEFKSCIGSTCYLQFLGIGDPFDPESSIHGTNTPNAWLGSIYLRSSNKMLDLAVYCGDIEPDGSRLGHLGWRYDSSGCASPAINHTLFPTATCFPSLFLDTGFITLPGCYSDPLAATGSDSQTPATIRLNLIEVPVGHGDPNAPQESPI